MGRGFVGVVLMLVGLTVLVLGGYAVFVYAPQQEAFCRDRGFSSFEMAFDEPVCFKLVNGSPYYVPMDDLRGGVVE